MPLLRQPTVVDAVLLGQRWVEVDSKKELIVVREGAREVARFENVAFGSGGVGLKVVQGDNVTPVGVFRVGWITRTTRFHLFIGLSYPSESYAGRALQLGRVSRGVFEEVSRALKEGRIPRQNTALGGHIGIHGIGKGSLQIHRNVNWTDGCIALDNQQIDALGRLVKRGMTVVVR